MEIAKKTGLLSGVPGEHVSALGLRKHRGVCGMHGCPPIPPTLWAPEEVPVPPLADTAFSLDPPAQITSQQTG